MAQCSGRLGLCLTVLMVFLCYKMNAVESDASTRHYSGLISDETGSNAKAAAPTKDEQRPDTLEKLRTDEKTPPRVRALALVEKSTVPTEMKEKSQNFGSEDYIRTPIQDSIQAYHKSWQTYSYDASLYNVTHMNSGTKLKRRRLTQRTNEYEHNELATENDPLKIKTRSARRKHIVLTNDKPLQHSQDKSHVNSAGGRASVESNDKQYHHEKKPRAKRSDTRNGNPLHGNYYQKDPQGKGIYCHNVTKFMAEPQKYFPTDTIPLYNETNAFETILIENRNHCAMPSYIKVNGTTMLNVTVETCCITSCTHEIQLEVESTRDILLNFVTFNVPGLNMARSEAVSVCEESLDVLAEVKSKNSTKDERLVLGSFCGIKAPTSVFVEHSKGKLALGLKNNAQCIDKINFEVQIVPCIKFDYKACNLSDYVKFERDQGYISSPGLVLGQNYPNDLECNWTITVPEGKLIRLEAKEIRLRPGDVIEIFPTYDHFSNSLKFPPLVRFSRHEFQQPVVLPGHTCTVAFRSDSIKSGVGFNLTYTAVNQSHFIPMFLNHSLDCSDAAHFKYLDTAMICNFHVDCARGEDEEDCDYKHPRCWPQGYAYDGHCYTLFLNQHNMSWTMAEEFCERNLSSYLVSLNTVPERNFINELRAYEGASLDVMFLGLRRMRMQQVSQMYRRMWQWTDGRTAFFLPQEYRYEGWSTCSLLHRDYFHSTECSNVKENVSFICEKTLKDKEVSKHTDSSQIPVVRDKIDVFHCTHSREYISKEQRCDRVPNCYDQSDELDCKNEQPRNMFSCEHGGLLAFTFVCDGIEGCLDESDENLCVRPDKASLGPNMTVCTDGMLLERSRLCDGKEDCRDGSDEEDCTECVGGSSLCPMIACLPKNWTTDSEIDCPIRDLKGRRAPEKKFRENVFTYSPPPGIIIPDGYGKFDIKPLKNDEVKCPETHWKCHDGYCIPIYMWCNGMTDCPNGEDENLERCEQVCKGMYKCKYSHVCVHNDHLCDGYYQCPNHDDEILCSLNITCPRSCECTRMEITCTSVPQFTSITPIRYLKLEGAQLSDLRVAGVASYSLIYLNVSACKVRNIQTENLRFLNLRILDLSHNEIEAMPNDALKHCSVLETLDLSYNKLINANFTFLEHARKLSKLDLSYNIKSELENDCFRKAVSLEELIMRYMNINKISANAFNGLINLKHLDLKGNDLLYFSSDIFKSPKNLQKIVTDNFRICCNSIKPKSVQHSACEAPYDEISSCADILRTLILRVALWLMAVLTILGNVGVIVYRIFYDRSIKYSFRIIITCLSASDLIMGIYLVIIGTADVIYRDRYLLVEREWKSSVPCQVAGFLCVLSSETSALFILLVTVDRLLAIAFPLHPALHFNGRSAAMACASVWIIGLIMASVPLLPPYQHWELYSHKAVGVPLPITRNHFPGYDYAFAIFILFNMAVFLLVAIGQLLIYLSVRLQKHPQISAARLRQDTAIAKRLILVVITDCLCWFPITVMGLAARSGEPVPGEMYLVATIFLLPANSAFNPFLYTANAILLARRNRKKKKLELLYGMRQLL